MKPRLLVLAFFFCAVSAHGQQVISGRGPFRIEMDVARFAAEESQTYLEVYYAIPEAILTFREDSAAYKGAVHMLLEIRSDSASVAKKEWVVPHVMADSAERARGQSLMGVVSVGIPKGQYRISVAAYDINDPSRRDSINAPISVKGYEEEKEDVSDIELASNIRQSTNKASVFYKNTLEVIPNASRMYGIGLPILQYYVEVYNLAKRPSSGPAVVRTSVISGAGVEVKKQSRLKSRQYNSTVEVGSVNLSGVGSGSYRLRITVVDTTRTPEVLLASAEKKFFVYRVGSAADSAAAAQTSVAAGGEFSFMTEPEVAQAFRYAQYIATENEERQFDQLPDLTSKQNFLADFWRRRDTDPSTSINEFKAAYYERIEYANEHLSNRTNDGWKSDQGRVYIVYGKCDEIERAPSTSESLPYEIWHYDNVQGGVIFVFVDRNNFGNYTLVHSTHRNELHNENWLQEQARRTN